ncbi:hypothetical protein OAT84_01070 [Gammaproteobacteria bacterium]|nr:hypothetical protein [Gammaproteobacteria bacterium]
MKANKMISVAVAICMLILAAFEAVPNQFFQMQSYFAQSWLGAPAVIVSPKQWDSTYALEAASVSIKLGAMLLIDDSSTLVHLQLIDQQYPVSGTLKTQLDQPLSNQGVWVDAGFAQQRQIKMGDQITLFGTQFIVEDFLEQQDEQIFSPEGLSPTVMISRSNMQRLGLDQDGLRASWYYYFDTNQAWRKEDLVGVKQLDASEQLGRLGRILDQAEDILLDLQLLSTLLIGLILYLVFSYAHLQSSYACGIMKAFGVPEKLRIVRLLKPMLLPIIIGLGIGALLTGTALQLLSQVLEGLGVYLNIQTILIRSFVLVLTYSSVMLVIFQYQLQCAPALQQLKHQPRAYSSWFIVLIATLFAVFVASSAWSLEVLMPTLIYLTAFALLLVSLAYWVMIVSMRYLATGSTQALIVLNRIRQRPQDSTMLLLAMVLMTLVLQSLWHIRYQSIDTFSQYVPEDAPNYFFIGMTDMDHDILIRDYSWYDQSLIYRVVRGQLVSINQEDIWTYQSGRYLQHEVFNRQLNLTSFDTLPEYNTLIQGELDDGISAEYGIMLRLGLKLGDLLTFNILGTQIELPITSIRRVGWQSLRANFYFVLPSAILNQFPASYLGSLRIAPTDMQSVNQAIRQFPNITYIDINAYITQAQKIITQVTNVLTQLLLLVAGIVGFAFYTVLVQQKKQRQLEWSHLKRLSLTIPHILTLEITTVFMIATMISQLMLVIGVYMLNLQRLSNWYYDIQSLILILIIWLILTLFSLKYDHYITSEKSHNQ